MSYSNGYNTAKVLPVLLERVNWMSEGESKSGRFFDDGSFHALISEQNLIALATTPKPTTQQIAATKASMKQAAVTRALTAVFNRNVLIEQSTFYGLVPGHFVEVETDSELVGFELTVPYDQNILIQLLNVVLSFSADTSVTLYAYYEGETEPFYEEGFDAEVGRLSVVPMTNMFLSHNETKGRTVIIGYKPSELSPGALPLRNTGSFKLQTCALGADAVEVYTLPSDYSKKRYTVQPAGINIEFMTQYDYSTRIVQLANLFDEIIGLTLASMFVEQLIFSTRINATGRDLKETTDKFAAQMDLTGVLPISSSPRVDGIRRKLGSEISRVQQNFLRQSKGVVTHG
jgi:hypothetical protein